MSTPNRTMTYIIMWSHISVILVLWSQVHVNHHICNVVNTHYSWSVYFCVYIYHAPPYGPCTPPTQTGAYASAMHMCCLGGRILCASIHHAWGICNKNSDLSNVNNCYAISCHVHNGVMGNDYRKGGTSSSRCTIYYPYRVGWLIEPSNIGQCCLPREFSACTSEYLQYSCSGAWNDRHRGSHVLHVKLTI